MGNIFLINAISRNGGALSRLAQDQKMLHKEGTFLYLIQTARNGTWSMVVCSTQTISNKRNSFS